MTGLTSTPKTSRTAIFTIAAGNYLHFVRTLMSHVAIHAPNADRWLGLCDTLDKASLAGENFQALPLSEIPLPEARPFIFQYTLLELSTAIKPFIIEHLAVKHGYDRIIYFDPDIGIYDSLGKLDELLNEHEIVLTPHITEGYHDERRPSDRDILQCGTYNLGFAAFRWTDKTAAFIRWWQKKLTHDCVVDFPRGLFVDQKWMEFAPSFVPGTFICHHPGWNVAYWNLPSREVSSDGKSRTVNGQPLVFYHFSGFHPDRGIFSGYQDRYTLDNLPTAVKTLASAYADELRKNGYPQTTQQRCQLNYFSTGVKIPDGARRIYHENYTVMAKKFPDPSGADASAFINYVNAPAEKHGKSASCVTRLAFDFYQHGPDLGLQEQFPDVMGIHAEAFAAWLLDANNMSGFEETFLQPIRDALNRNGEIAGAAAATSFSKWLYKQAWKFKHLTHWLLPLPVRQRIHGWMFNRAYVTSSSVPASAAISRDVRTDGINIIGYLRAELGIGEAGRSLARAAKAAGLNVTLKPFTTGSDSRMHEKIGDDPNAGTNEHDINLIVLNAEQIPYAVAEFDPAFFKGKYNIAVWNWELPELPASWHEVTKFVDEVWAPSAFCHEAFSRSLDLPVVRMPYAIDFTVDPKFNRHHFGLPESSFLFLFMFDVFSVPERKNPLGLLDAFIGALPEFKRPVCLVLKISNADKDTETIREIKNAAAIHPEIRIIPTYLSREELNGLFQCADCYVSLHRSEGFGLTIAESMFLGKPVIATGWSSNMDFMTPWNSYSVKYRLITLEKDHGPYQKGQQWAEPDIDHAKSCMISVVNNPDEARRRGQQAALDIRSMLSPEVIGRRIRQRLDYIRG